MKPQELSTFKLVIELGYNVENATLAQQISENVSFGLYDDTESGRLAAWEAYAKDPNTLIDLGLGVGGGATARILTGKVIRFVPPKGSTGKVVGDNVPEAIPPRFSGFEKDNLSFESINKQIDNLDVSVGKDQAVFYSGTGARDAAENFATKNNLTTLEKTLGGKILDDLKLFEGTVSDINRDKAGSLWGNISSNFANQAKGKVTAIVNNPSPTSIFITKELPALLKNSDVTEVVVRSASGKSISIPKGTSINNALEMIKGF